ncbi:MAG: hypothetical protein AAFR31_02955 [Cyanobacteria bacterium J06627_8]
MIIPIISTLIAMFEAARHRKVIPVSPWELRFITEIGDRPPGMSAIEEIEV